MSGRCIYSHTWEFEFEKLHDRETDALVKYVQTDTHALHIHTDIHCPSFKTLHITACVCANACFSWAMGNLEEYWNSREGGSKLKDTSDGKAIEIKMTAMVRAREAEKRQRGLAAERGRRAFFFCALTLLLFFLSFPRCIHFAQNSVAKREMSRPGRPPQSAAHVYKHPPTHAHS